MLFMKIYCSVLVEQKPVHFSLTAFRVIRRHGLQIGFRGGVEVERFC